MFAIERVKIIKNHLLKDQKVSVAKLSELLDVTEVTIRRDLEKLEKEGFLKRTHGGAVLISYVEESLYDDEQDEALMEHRQEIANTAYHLVSDYDSIMLFDGATNLQIAKKLSAHNNLTVVTNDLRIALEFSSAPSNNLILLGGTLDSQAVFGQMAIDNMKAFSFNHLFIEIDGVSDDMSLSVKSVKKATLIQQAMHLADTTTIVCLSHNFGMKSLYRIGKINIASEVITDSELSDFYKNAIFNYNIPLYTSVEIYEA